jgi:hypothetical protein
VFTSDGIALCGVGPDPDIPNNAAQTTNQLSTSGAFVAGGVIRTSDAIPNIDMVQNGKTENEYCLTLSSSTTAADTYDIRLYKQDGTAIDAYTVTPRMTVMAPSAGMGF